MNQKRYFTHILLPNSNVIQFVLQLKYRFLFPYPSSNLISQPPTVFPTVFLEKALDFATCFEFIYVECEIVVIYVV